MLQTQHVCYMLNFSAGVLLQVVQSRNSVFCATGGVRVRRHTVLQHFEDTSLSSCCSQCSSAESDRFVFVAAFCDVTMEEPGGGPWSLFVCRFDTPKFKLVHCLCTSRLVRAVIAHRVHRLERIQHVICTQARWGHSVHQLQSLGCSRAHLKYNIVLCNIAHCRRQ